jgi:hypothetical protein
MSFRIFWHICRGDLGYLEQDLATVADDLGVDLDQLLAQAGQRPRFRRLGYRQRPHETAKVVGATGGGGAGHKGAARQSRPLDRALASLVHRAAMPPWL